MRINDLKIEEHYTINGMEEQAFRASVKADIARKQALYGSGTPKPIETTDKCPLHDDYRLIRTTCRMEKCAVFVDGHCIFAGYTPIRDTKGSICPLSKASRSCHEDCALYNGGCTLTGLTPMKERSNKDE